MATESFKLLHRFARTILTLLLVCACSDGAAAAQAPLVVSSNIAALPSYGHIRRPLAKCYFQPRRFSLFSISRMLPSTNFLRTAHR